MTLQEEVEALAQPEGRVVGTLGHEQARQHLVGRLQKIGLSPYRGHTFSLPYRAAGRDFCNLSALAPGRDPALAPVLIASTRSERSRRWGGTTATGARSACGKTW